MYGFQYVAYNACKFKLPAKFIDCFSKNYHLRNNKRTDKTLSLFCFYRFFVAIWFNYVLFKRYFYEYILLLL